MPGVIRPETGEEHKAFFDPGAYCDTTIQIY